MSFLTNANKVNELADLRIAANVGSVVQGYNSLLQDISNVNPTANSNKAIVVNGAGTNLTLSPTLGTAAFLNTGITSGNIPVLDSNGKLASSVIPNLAISNVHVVTTLVDRDNLVTSPGVQTGDFAIVTGVGKTFVYDGTTWQELVQPASLITSVAGKTGAVTLVLDDNTDVTLSSPTNGNILSFNGSVWVNTVLNLADTTGTLPVTRGGTGVTTIPARSALIAQTANNLAAITATAAGQVIRFDGTNLAFQRPSYADLTGTPTIDYGRVQNVTVVTGAGAYTATNTNHVIVINKTISEATTVNLPAGTTNKVFIIKDGKGDSNVNPITIDPNSIEQIDGSSTLVINSPYESVMLVWNGTQWNIV